MVSPKIANKIWLYTQKKHYQTYVENTKEVEAFQLKKLHNYLTTNVNTTFGEDHHFDQITSYAAFKSKVPIYDWKGLAPYVDQIAKGQRNVLTTEKVLRFEETSGTATASKLIPYTQNLLAEFQTAIATWMYSTYLQAPNVFQGKAYWSISPATRQQRKTKGGVSIGVADDRSYFNPVTNYLLQKILAVPPQVAKLEAENFYLETLAYLLSQENLAFVSAWSPSFLLVMDTFLQENKRELLENKTFLRHSKKTRVSFLKEILSKDFTWDMIWKNLHLVSCWTDAQAKLLSEQLQKRMGKVAIQGKGLLSTECVCSIPFRKGQPPALSYCTHFYEFRDANTGKIFLAHELILGGVYEIIVTTGGGLYRYATADLIQVQRFFNQVPCFYFLGRKNKQSDLVGEKLAETQVNRVINEVFTAQKNCTWLFIAPVKCNDISYQYQLNIELKPNTNFRELKKLTFQTEALLQKNIYYKEAVELGQLRPLSYQILPFGTREKYLEKIRKGGNAKEAVIKNQYLVSLEKYLIIKEISRLL